MFKKLGICLLLSAYCLVPAWASSTTDISVVSVGARSVGMGRAGVAIASDANNVFVNPAAIANTKSFELTSMSTQMLGMVDYRFLGGALKTGRGTFGLSYVGTTSPAGYYTTDGTSIGNAINYGSSVTALSYGVNLKEVMKVNSNLGRVLVGANLKYFNQGFSGGATSSSAGLSGDLGVLFEANQNVSWGLNLQNALGGKVTWATGTADDISSVVKAGGAFKLLGGKVLSAVDIEFSGSKPMTLHGGLEWKPVELLALRAGIDQDAISSSATVSNLTTGVGINLRGFQVDLAYRQDATLSDNSNFYLSLSYAPFVPEVEVTQNPKSEILNPKQTQNSNDQVKKTEFKPSHSLEYYKSIGLAK